MPIFSASQIDTFDHERGGCERKWGFEKIEGLPRPPNKYAQRGLDLHDVAERFLKSGILPPENEAGKVFRAGLPHLPPPGTGVTEGPFRFHPDGEPYLIQGRIDWRALPGEISAFGIDLLDHKSTSSKDWSWSKDEATLMKDAQGVIYSAYTMHQLQRDTIRARWVNYRWTPERPKAKPVGFVMTLPHVAAEFERIKEVCRRMAWRHEQKIRAVELPYNVAACDAFGGCPFRTQCGLSPQERMRAHMSQMSLKEKMEARKAQTPAVNPPAAAAAPAPAAPPPAQAAIPLTVVPVAPPAAAAPPAPVAAAQPAAAAAPAAVGGPAAPAGAVVSLADKLRAKQAAPPAAASAAPAAPAAAAPAPVAPPAAAPVAAKAPVAAAPPAPTRAQFEDLALACEMIGHGFKSIAQHFRSL